MTFPIANILTMARIVMIPLVVILFYLPYSWSAPAAGLVFGLAAVTDSLDGYLARRLGQTSALGAFLDPVADKLMVAVALVLVASGDPRWFIVVSAIIIIGREITVSALREWMAEIGARAKVAVSNMGKWKTIFQMVGLSFLLYRDDLFGLPIYLLGIVATVAAAALTLSSMIAYLRAAWPDLVRSRSQ